MDYKIFENVEIGENVDIGPYCIIGMPPRGSADGDLKTVIGDNSVIRSHSIIYAGNVIGSNFSTGHHVVIREKNKIGSNVSIGTHSVVEHQSEIGDGVRMHSNVFVPEFSKLEQGAWIGPNCVLTNAKFPQSNDVKENLLGPRICKDAKVGANSTILPGVTIGPGALIGAGSVVTKDVEEHKISLGNPAKVHGNIDESKYKT